jgi:spore germination protein GerM
MIPRNLQIAALVLLVAVFGMGVYVLRTKRKSEQIGARPADQRPIALPAAGPTAHVTLYVAYDGEGAIKRREVNIALPPEPAERAREVLRALLAVYQEKPSPHVIGSGADIKSVYLISGNTAVLDASDAFASQHPSGVLSESLTIASMVQTLAANSPGITQVKFLVEGRERDTLAGHADLRDFYDVSAVTQAMRQFQ